MRRSHIWTTGQDQCALIKRQLQMLLPGIAVFLDVDDLNDIGDLEGYIKATGVILCFLSRRYFVSRNCLREVRATLDQGKPIVLVQEEQDTRTRKCWMRCQCRHGWTWAPACCPA